MTTFQVVRNASVVFVTLMALAHAGTPGGTNPPTPTPVAPASAPTEASSSVPAPTSVEKPEAGLRNDALNLGSLRQQIANADERLKLLAAQEQIKQAEKRLGQSSAATSDIPALIGIEGTVGRMRAQFLIGTTITTVDAGRLLTNEWRVEKITPNGAVLTRVSGAHDVHTILFGHAPVSGGAHLLSMDASAASPAPMPAMPPMSPIPQQPATMPSPPIAIGTH